MKGGARAAAQAGELTWVIGVQGDAEKLIEGAIEAGQPEESTRFFESSEEAGKFIVDLVNAGDVLLVKGSRGVKMERIIEALDASYTRSPEARISPASARERG